ncbi:hypothetical protein ACFSL4_01890 [Streptomyces caeni]|uniref:ATP-grasp-modified RiPP n=1 Tax=Streptomyces caeni TaxID=2307231 RepID=A0ABW4IJF6_9ACTN
MANSRALLPPRVKMTIRVYTVDRYGTVTQDRGTVVALPHGHEPAAEPCSPACVHEGGTR